MVEILITYLQYLFSGYIELIAVGIQILLFFLILKPFDFSTAAKLLLSFNISYLIICVWMFRVFVSFDKVKMRFASPKLFWRSTKGSHLIGVSLGVVDRLDRFIIAFYFPTGTLARYSAMSSLISYFRFVPEFFSRIMISGYSLPYVVLRKHKFIVIILFTTAIGAIIFSSRLFILNFLGYNWLLLIGVFVAFGIQEILRGAYQISLNYNSKLELSLSTRVIPIALLSLAAIFSSLTVRPFGVIGIPIAFSAAFLAAIFLTYLWRNKAKGLRQIDE